jgi:hypothetical protein
LNIHLHHLFFFLVVLVIELEASGVVGHTCSSHYSFFIDFMYHVTFCFTGNA